MSAPEIRVRPAAERGVSDFGWLSSRHSFSFGGYVDPEQMGFRALRVINDDLVAPGAGFPTHGHRDMEIVSWVLEGELEHRDSLGNAGVVRAGEMQVMSAGTGIRHSEFNASRHAPLRFLQIWILPDAGGHAPRWQQVDLGSLAGDGVTRVVGPEGAEAPMTVHQAVSVDLLDLAAGRTLDLTPAPGRLRYLHLVEGALRIDDGEIGPGDAIAADASGGLAVEVLAAARGLLFDLPEGPVALTGTDLPDRRAA
jgi:redox-sensitive bicupin YhaK (pirin superfamily)